MAKLKNKVSYTVKILQHIEKPKYITLGKIESFPIEANNLKKLRAFLKEL